LDRWTIWFTANGATGRSGFAAANDAFCSVIWLSQSVSSDAGRALRAGNEPTMPDVHWATTISGPDTMNIGDATTGRLSGRRRISGRATGVSSGLGGWARRPGPLANYATDCIQ
jgi:hypothetical protein